MEGPAVPVGEGGAGAASMPAVPAVAAVSAASEEAATGPAEVADTAPAPKQVVVETAGGGGAGAVAVVVPAVAAVPATNEKAAVVPTKVGSVAGVDGAGKAARGCDPHEGLTEAAKAGTQGPLRIIPRLHRCKLPIVKGVMNRLRGLAKFLVLYALFILAAYPIVYFAEM